MAKIFLDAFSALGEKLESVGYMTEFEGYNTYVNDPKAADFDYLPTGILHFKLSNGRNYCISDYNTTKLAVNGVGIKDIGDDYSDLLSTSYSKTNNIKWSDYIGQTIESISAYIQNEGWGGYDHNEEYPESMEICFGNGKSVFFFCGDVNVYSDEKQRYTLLGGRSSGLIFFDRTTFSKYGLDQVERIERYFLKKNRD